MKSRAIQIRMVKTPDANAPATAPQGEYELLDPEKLSTLLKEQIKYVALAVVAAAAAITVLHTASEVVINNTNPEFK